MDYSPSRGPAAASYVGVFFVLAFYLAIAAVFLVAYWRIITKAGYPGWYLLLALVPCVNIVGILMFAFTEWPIEKELKQWRASGGGAGYYPRYGAPGPNQPPSGPPPSNPPFYS
jgi:hypothetical protein